MLEKLPPRERQIVDLLYAEGEATVAEIRSKLADELSASAVRAMLTRLESKGYVSRHQSDRGYLFAPIQEATSAKQSALGHIVKVFFNGSAAGAASALLGMSDSLDDDELDELERLIAAHRKEQP